MPNDPYLNESGILKNKFNLDDSELLEKEIAIQVFLGSAYIKKYFHIRSLFDVQKIHYELFQDVFSWAGEFRTITMYKAEPILNGCTVDYSPEGYIEKELKEIDDYFLNVEFEKLKPIDKIKEITKIIAEVWRIHPFREGNTRTTALLLYLLLIQNGFKVRYTFLQEYAKYFRNALVLASLYSKSETEYLEGIITDIVSIQKIDDGKYKTIENYDVEKYNYSYHTLEKLKIRCEKNRK